MFIPSIELLDFLHLFNRHLAARHLAGDFELGAFILFALFERGLGHGIPFIVELGVLAARVDTKPALEAILHQYAAFGFISGRGLRVALLGVFARSAVLVNDVAFQCDRFVLSDYDETQYDNRCQ